MSIPLNFLFHSKTRRSIFILIMFSLFPSGIGSMSEPPYPDEPLTKLRFKLKLKFQVPYLSIENYSEIRRREWQPERKRGIKDGHRWNKIIERAIKKKRKKREWREKDKRRRKRERDKGQEKKERKKERERERMKLIQQ